MGRRRDHRHGGKRATTDGFMNFTARLGLGGDNTLAAGRYQPSGGITRQRQALEEMYRTSWVVGRMVDVVAEDMLRGGIDIQAQLDPGEVDQFLRYMRRMRVQSRLTDAVKGSRLYGGSLALILLDGENPAEPLDVGRVSKDSFRGLHVLDRHQVDPSHERITDLGPMMGYPEYYSVHTEQQRAGLRLHHSRVIRFVGVELPYEVRLTENHWGASVVERAYDRILALDSATHGSANLIFKSFLRFIKVEGLRQILAAGGPAEQALTRMFEMIRRMQSNEGITLLDKNDDFGAINWTFSGIYDALQAFAEQIAGATGVPLVRLLGQSPKGFSTGESDLRTYYDTISTQQEDDLRPAYERLLPVMARSLWGKALPEGTTFEFRSLWQPSELERSQIATADAQSVAGLYSAGIITESQSLAELRDAGRVTDGSRA
jgi:phage-related protein (TIGR01555 family)